MFDYLLDLLRSSQIDQNLLNIIGIYFNLLAAASNRHCFKTEALKISDVLNSHKIRNLSCYVICI